MNSNGSPSLLSPAGIFATALVVAAIFLTSHAGQSAHSLPVRPSAPATSAAPAVNGGVGAALTITADSGTGEALTIAAAPDAAPQHAAPAVQHASRPPVAPIAAPSVPAVPVDSPAPTPAPVATCWDAGLSPANECEPVCPATGCLPAKGDVQ